MAIVKEVTLTEKGLNAGPDYEIWFSSNGINYIQVQGTFSLPEIGDSVTVNVADDAQYIKLINLSPTCNENEVVVPLFTTTTTTQPPTTTLPPLPTTTTTAGPATTTTTLNPAFTTTTTYASGSFVQVIAHACQNYSDFNRYSVPSNPSPQINGVYKDAYGTCYYITSIPTNQATPVGTLTYVGTEGSCTSSSCVTTTTTVAPYCNKWSVSNGTGAGYYFKYYYCGQDEATYLEVPAGQTVTVCTQNDKIYNSFNAPLTFNNLAESCIGTTTTTTLPPDLWRVVAHACQDFYDFNTYGVNKNITQTVNIGDVLKDTTGKCYYITSIPNNQSGPVVGTLAYVGGQGACSSSQCVTTTTTAAPFCTNWKVENTAGAGQYFKYQYCGQTNFLYPEVPAKSSVIVCVQNNKIFDAFNTTLVFTQLGTSCNATTTTTTTQGPKVLFRAAPCQNIANFNTYQANSASYALGDVFKDSDGTCYSLLSFGGAAAVGNLTFFGGPGSCSSPSCVTTTTTAAPYCNTYKVENLAGAGYYFKYKYCGQNTFTYLEVPPYGTVEVCVQNDEIYNSFNAPLSIDNLGTTCIGTTTTTTTLGPKVIFTAAPCDNIYNFNVFQAASASYNIGDVFIDNTNTCYSILSFNGQVPVGELTYLAPSGSCGQAPCVTTTTTAAPFCNLWQVTNPFGASYSFKYKYCGQTDFTYPSVAPNSSMIVCVQNDEIYNSFGAPITFDNLEVSCVGTTTTTSTTTTTTLAPGCFLYDVFNYGGGSAQFRYVYCGASVTSSVTLPSQGQTTVCVDNNKIETSYFGITWTRTTGSCAATTTTTTTTSTTTTTTQAPFSNKFSADAWFYANNFPFDVAYTASTLLASTATINPASGNTILVGGPSFIASEYDTSDSRRSDAHFFILSGSALRTSPTQNPTTPIAKVLNVTNVTSNTVPLNYVNVSGSLVGVTLSSGSSTQITSQTLPFGLDGFVLGGTAWLSASFDSDFTGSVTAYQRGPRFYSFTGVRTVAQQEQTYVTPSGSTTPVLYTLGQPVSGSSVYYRCSVTIPFVRNGLYVVNDLGGCGGNTTTTTTSTTTTTAGPAAFSNVWTAEGWYAASSAGTPQTISYFDNRNIFTSSVVTNFMGNTLLLGGPAFSASISSNTGNLRLDAHYFAASGSSFRTAPYEQVLIPKAKVLNVTNITNRTVPLNYVNISGSLVAQTLASGSSTQITSQTIPFGYDNTNGLYQYISASIVSDYTGSLTPYQTGSKWYKMTAVASVSSNDFLYTVQNGLTTGTGELLTFPISGSTTIYRCSRTIPNTQRGYYVVEYVAECNGGTTTTTTTTTTTSTTTTTTTTTAGPTTTTTTLTPPPTTTTTTIASQNVVIYSCPDGTITTPITLAVNGPRLMGDKIVRILGGFAGYDCYYVTNIAYTGSIIYNATVENLFANCEDCEANQTTTTTTLAPTTTTTTEGGVTTTTTCAGTPIACNIFVAQNGDGTPNLNAYYTNCDGVYTSIGVYPRTSIQFCSISTLLELLDDPNNAPFIVGYPSDNTITGPYSSCGTYCGPATTTTTSTTTSTTTTTSGPTTTTTTISQTNPVTSSRVLELNASTGSYSGSGSVWYDISGNGFNFTLQNSPSFNRSTGFTFNGSNQWARLGAGSGLQSYFTGSVRGGITLFVDCIIQSSSIDDSSLFSGWNDQGSVYKWLLEANYSTNPAINNSIESAVRTSTTGIVGNNTTGSAFVRGNRSIVAFTVLNDSVGSKNIYVNNVLISGSQGVPNENWALSNPIFSIGARLGGAGNAYKFLSGSVASVIAYNRALSDFERTNVYNYLVGTAVITTTTTTSTTTTTIGPTTTTTSTSTTTTTSTTSTTTTTAGPGGNPVSGSRVLELNNSNASYNGSGSVWYDVSGNGFNFVLQNSPSFSTTDGFTLNGSTQYASYTGSALQSYFTGSARGGITVFVDISGSTSTANDWAMVSGWKDQGATYKWLFEVNTNNTIESAVKTTPTGVTGQNTTGTITRAQRNIMAFTVKADGTKEVYANDVALSGTQTVPNENWDTDSPPITIGARINNTNNPFQYLNGKVKSVVVYNRELTSGERTSVYNYLNGL